MKILASTNKYPLDKFVGKDTWVKVIISDADMYFNAHRGPKPYGGTFYVKLTDMDDDSYYAGFIDSEYVEDAYGWPGLLNNGAVISRELTQLATPLEVFTDDEIRSILTLN